MKYLIKSAIQDGILQLMMDSKEEFLQTARRILDLREGNAACCLRHVRGCVVFRMNSVKTDSFDRIFVPNYYMVGGSRVVELRVIPWSSINDPDVAEFGDAAMLRFA